MPTLTKARMISDPALNPGDEPYFAGATEGKLLLKSCKACHSLHHYPRALCPFCWSSDLEWVEATGGGEIYTFSITRRGAGAPYCIGYVALDDGPVLMTNIVDCDLDTVKIGQRVTVVFQQSENGTSIPMFTPSSEHGRIERA